MVNPPGTGSFSTLVISLTTQRESGQLKRYRGTPVPSWTFIASLVLRSMALVAVMVVVLLALGAIPIPKLRSALLRLQLQMAATLGDCYVLLERPIEAASIVSGVRRDLRWLSARCSEVVVVAHSQGGAIAPAVAAADPRIAAVVTFAGPVAGTVWVTVAHDGGVLTSYGPLRQVLVRRGAAVGLGVALVPRGRRVEGREGHHDPG